MRLGPSVISHSLSKAAAHQPLGLNWAG